MKFCSSCVNLQVEPVYYTTTFPSFLSFQSFPSFLSFPSF